MWKQNNFNRWLLISKGHRNFIIKCVKPAFSRLYNDQPVFLLFFSHPSMSESSLDESSSAGSDSIKYILVSGGVISGVGKGVITSSIGTLLKGVGLRVTAIKIDPYLNIDAGTFSPYEHGMY